MSFLSILALVFFAVQDLFSLMQSSWSIFAFVSWTFGIKSKNHWLDNCHVVFSLGFLPGAPQRLVLNVNVSSILSWFLYMVWNKDSVSFFWIWIPSFSNTLLKRLSFLNSVFSDVAMVYCIGQHKLKLFSLELKSFIKLNLKKRFLVILSIFPNSYLVLIFNSLFFNVLIFIQVSLKYI